MTEGPQYWGSVAQWVSGVGTTVGLLLTVGERVKVRDSEHVSV
jgi:hypothetical protein